MTHTWEEIEQRKQDVAEQYSWLLFYDLNTITPNKWMGKGIQKNPLDLFIYQEIAFEVKPKLVIETGSFNGGSSIFWADMMRLVHGVDDYTQVISIDVNPPPFDPSDINRNITFYSEGSLSPKTLELVKVAVKHANGPVLVNLDSLHDFGHVYGELEAYSQFVTPGSYMIVEDGVINGHPTHPEYGPGPYEACEQFLVNHPEFEVDYSRERFFVTANPMGYLRRK